MDGAPGAAKPATRMCSTETHAAQAQVQLLPSLLTSAQVSVGTETDGSIVCPSAVNGIVGIKPTLGLISRSGIIPIAHSQDTPGPMARTVRDAAILLNVLVGPDPGDPATKESTSKVEPDYTKFLDLQGLRGARLGIARRFFGFNAALDRVINDCIAVMRREGAEIIDPVDYPSHEKLKDTELDVLLYEFKSDLNAYLKDARRFSLR